MVSSPPPPAARTSSRSLLSRSRSKASAAAGFASSVRPASADGAHHHHLHLGAAAAGSSTKRRSWALGDEAAAEESGRTLRGCPGPLPDAAKFGLSLDLGMTKEGQGLDRTVARFVTYHEGGAAATGGPCFRFRVGANMDNLTEHWPACPTKFGRDVLPAPQDQLVQDRGALMLAMLHRFGSAAEPWPLDPYGLPDWAGVTDALRGPPGEGFYPVHPSDVEGVSDTATRELASKLMDLLEQPRSRLGCVGGALRLIAQSEEGAALGITDRAVMAKFLRRRAEPTPDARTGGLYATESEIGAEALWDDDDERELAWVQGLAEQASEAVGALYQRKLRAISEGGVSAAAGAEAAMAGEALQSEDSRRLLQRRQRQLSQQRPSSAAPTVGRGDVSAWQQDYGQHTPSVHAAWVATRKQRGISAWASVRHIAGVGGPPLHHEHETGGSLISPLGQGAERPTSQKTAQGSVQGAEHGATVEEEEQLDLALEDMFDVDASRTFFVNRIPRVLTPGASYFDKSEGSIAPTPLELFHASRLEDASVRRRPATAGGSSRMSSSFGASTAASRKFERTLCTSGLWWQQSCICLQGRTCLAAPWLRTSAGRRGNRKAPPPLARRTQASAAAPARVWA